MKKLLILHILLVVIAAVAQEIPALPIAKATFRVIDEENRPIPDAKVGVVLSNPKTEGSARSANAKSVYESTDMNGLATVTGNCNGYLSGGVSKAGYYWSKTKPLTFQKSIA